MYWYAIALGPPVEVLCIYASLLPLDSSEAESKVNPSPLLLSIGVLNLLNLIIPEK